MATTTSTITDSQIEALLRAQQAGGDLLKTAICLRALGALSEASSTHDVPRSLRINDANIVRIVMAVTVEEARGKCARIIANAEAQADGQ